MRMLLFILIESIDYMNFLKMEAVLYRNMKNYYKPISGKAAMLIPR